MVDVHRQEARNKFSITISKWKSSWEQHWYFTYMCDKFPVL